MSSQAGGMMTEPATTSESMERFLRGELSRRECQQMVRRLLTGSPVPVSTTPAGAEPAELSYDAAFGAASREVETTREQVEQESTQAARLWAFLESHPQPRRMVMIRNDRRLQTWGLYDFFLRRARSQDHDPADAIEPAELAVTVAESLPAARYGAARVADFQAAALGTLGEARRLHGDLTGARQALRRATEALGRGTQDLVDRAELKALEGHLLCETGDLSGAAERFERAAALFRRVGDLRMEHATLDLCGCSGRIRPKRDTRRSNRAG
jgi:tetratricopeptide (TPR) repeat protein